ncbi:MAG: TIGR04222 domain-containing membrane protein [Planctomycetaceae bacterium]
MNPLNLFGPEFLVFYWVLAGLLLSAGIALRWWLRTPADDDGTDTSGLSPYEVTYLAGAEAATFDAATARLVQGDMLTASASNRTLARSTCPLSEQAASVEQAIHEAVGDSTSGTEVVKVREKYEWAMRPLKRHLQELGLVVSDSDGWSARFLPLLLFLCVPLLGAIKIVVGLSRGRPVSFLVVGSIFLIVVGLIVLGRKVHRSRRGDRVLARLKSENAALRYGAASHSQQLAGSDLVMAVGLFGVSILADGPLAHLVLALRPPPQAGSNGGCGSGGSSCGGGGGGCGGGGCGGCGS